MIPLPIDGYVDAIRARLSGERAHRAVVITAQPGAGKTTRVPPALLAAGPLILLQPRRVAARAVAARIADEHSWTLGEEVGWQIRFERRASPRTRLLVVTEGILTARLQSDPFLTDFATIVIDEFHERSVHADLAMALARQAWRARDDLRLVVMSATLDVEPVQRFLDGCPVIDVPGQLHPVDVTYTPELSPAAAAAQAATAGDGDVLCFLPGAGEIARTIADLQSGPFALERPGAAAAGASRTSWRLLPLHGSLDSAAQDLALRPAAAGERRVIVATNIAETSLTVPGVRAVIDAGLQKVARYDPARGIDSLETERIPQDAADQRAGRAGRLAPGRVWRLWDARDRLRPHREPDLHRIDLAGVALDILAWGGEPLTFEWFEAPRADRVQTALDLLRRLGALSAGRLTSLGQQMQRLPLHPRLARMIMAADGHPDIVRACALLSERIYLPPRHQATTSDLLSALDGWAATPPHIRQVAREIARLCQSLPAAAAAGPLDERAFRRAVLAGYPDRVARRREAGSPRVKLSSGAGASLSRDSGVLDAEFLIALDVRGSSQADSTIPIASAIESDWLQPTATTRRTSLDESSRSVRSAEVEYYDEIVLRERPAPLDEEAAAALLVDAWQRRGFDDVDARLVRRLRFAGQPVDDATLKELMRAAAWGQRSLDALRLLPALDPQLVRRLDRDAPEQLTVPSGRSVRLEYGDDGGVSAAVKLQELFGLAETPRVGPQQPVTLELLAPNGRPVQVTRDLRSFWDRTYPEVRRELRGRYPKHPWPEDPWTATPTARTKRASQRPTN